MQYPKYLVLLCSLFVWFSTSPNAVARCYPFYVDATPQDALIKIMNIGPKFWQGICLLSGRYDVEVHKPGYQTWRQQIWVSRQKTLTVKLKPQLNSYRLYVNAMPRKANISILNIGPKYQHDMFLTAGKYEIEVSNPRCKTHRQWIDLQEDFTLDVKLACQKPEPKTYTLSIPNPEPGEYEVVLSNGSEPQLLEMTVQAAPLKIRFTKLADCRLNTHEGIKELAIKGQYFLRFVRVDYPNQSQGVVDIALRQAQAEQFYRQAQQMLPPHSSLQMPFIFRAVSEKPIFKKESPTFWIQSEPISSTLYQAIIPEGSSNSVSYEDATQVINTLNEWCEGTALFELPSEQQFVQAARTLYNPVETGQLKSCDSLGQEDSERKIKKLLGYQWQLTRSRCRSFDADTSDDTRKCDEQMYVKKGGSFESRDATECMPEYRAKSAPDIREPNTTFRLILLDLFY